MYCYCYLEELVRNMNWENLVPNLVYILPQYESCNLNDLCKRKQVVLEHCRKISVPS